MSACVEVDENELLVMASERRTYLRPSSEMYGFIPRTPTAVTSTQHDLVSGSGMARGTAGSWSDGWTGPTSSTLTSSRPSQSPASLTKRSCHTGPHASTRARSSPILASARSSSARM